MLPDWPETKDAIGTAFINFIKAEVTAKSGFLAEIPRARVHEGDSMAIRRADGTSHSPKFSPISGEMAVRVDEFSKLTIPEILAQLRGVAEQLAQGQSAHAFETLEEASREAGTEVDAAGKPMTAELILETWRRMEIPFDQDGRAQLPTMVVAPSQRDAVEAEVARLASDPDLRQRADEIIAQKRSAWIAREADRTLVG
ncbi:hypothetical protein [Muricoccus nepalensis]|uniref:hypothetical protein n=1 Tax=Muricoccus nepalensis TaxID=1854500 RepID=UPI00112AB6B7|nr:hypothetical protein [Roseomonas nepalensis]